MALNRRFACSTMGSKGRLKALPTGLSCSASVSKKILVGMNVFFLVCSRRSFVMIFSIADPFAVALRAVSGVLRGHLGHRRLCS